MVKKEFPTLLFPQMERNEKILRLRQELQKIKDGMARQLYWLSKSEISEFFSRMGIQC